MRFLLALALVIAAPAFAADQFDLICTSRHHDALFHYRVDLASRTYCYTTSEGDACPQYAIEDIGSDTIIFNGYAPADIVNRTTGEWTFRDAGTLYRGTCEPAPFSGFPKLVTKF